MRTPADMLTRCHRRLEERLDDLCHAAETLADERSEADRRDNARLDIDDALQFLARTLGRHIADEEASVFPRLRGDAALELLCQRLTAEHREQERLVDSLRTQAASWPDEPPAAAVQSFAAEARELEHSLRAHASLEDAELVPALAGLGEADLATLGEEMDGRRGGGGGGGRR